MEGHRNLGLDEARRIEDLTRECQQKELRLEEIRKQGETSSHIYALPQELKTAHHRPNMDLQHHSWLQQPQPRVKAPEVVLRSAGGPSVVRPYTNTAVATSSSRQAPPPPYEAHAIAFMQQELNRTERMTNKIDNGVGDPKMDVGSQLAADYRSCVKSGKRGSVSRSGDRRRPMSLYKEFPSGNISTSQAMNQALCGNIFHQHQQQADTVAKSNRNYVVLDNKVACEQPASMRQNMAPQAECAQANASSHFQTTNNQVNMRPKPKPAIATAVAVGGQVKMRGARGFGRQLCQGQQQRPASCYSLSTNVHVPQMMQQEYFSKKVKLKQSIVKLEEEKQQLKLRQQQQDTHGNNNCQQRAPVMRTDSGRRLMPSSSNQQQRPDSSHGYLYTDHQQQQQAHTTTTAADQRFFYTDSQQQDSNADVQQLKYKMNNLNVNSGGHDTKRNTAEPLSSDANKQQKRARDPPPYPTSYEPISQDCSNKFGQCDAAQYYQQKPCTADQKEPYELAWNLQNWQGQPLQQQYQQKCQVQQVDQMPFQPPQSNGDGGSGRKTPPPAYPDFPTEFALMDPDMPAARYVNGIKEYSKVDTSSDYHRAINLIQGNAAFNLKKYTPTYVEEAFKSAGVKVGGTFNNQTSLKRQSGSYSAAPLSKLMNFDDSMSGGEYLSVASKKASAADSKIALAAKKMGTSSSGSCGKIVCTEPVFLHRLIDLDGVEENKGRMSKSGLCIIDKEYKFIKALHLQDLLWTTVPRVKGERALQPTTRREVVCPDISYKHFVELRMENLERDMCSRHKSMAELAQKIESANFGQASRQNVKQMYFAQQSAALRLRRSRIGISHFQLKKIIGIGAFGKVVLARMKTNGVLYAIKSLKKTDVLKRNQAGHIIAERDILSECDSDWVVKLFHTFQDAGHLYFVMEYVPGGDLMNLLCRESIFSESMARFYTAELVLALEYVHEKGFIHRDVKPDNIMLTARGHIKLTDFGLCTGFRWRHDSGYYRPESVIPVTEFPHRDGYQQNDQQFAPLPDSMLGYKERKRMEADRRRIAQSLVGTPNYISPEVLQTTGHTHVCDFWSTGVILFEMVCGYPPFYEPNAVDTQVKILKFETTFCFPHDAIQLQPETRDIINKFIKHQDVRLGRNGTREIKQHPFFNGIDWKNLANSSAPFQPKFKSNDDTSNFDLPNTGVDSLTLGKEQTMGSKPNDMPGAHAFLEFTFRRMIDEDKRSQAPYLMEYDPHKKRMVKSKKPVTSEKREDKELTLKVLEMMDKKAPKPAPPPMYQIPHFKEHQQQAEQQQLQLLQQRQQRPPPSYPANMKMMTSTGAPYAQQVAAPVVQQPEQRRARTRQPTTRQIRDTVNDEDATEFYF